MQLICHVIQFIIITITLHDYVGALILNALTDLLILQQNSECNLNMLLWTIKCEFLESELLIKVLTSYVTLHKIRCIAKEILCLEHECK